MSATEGSSDLSRSEFLRLAALGAGGLGLTAVAGCAAPPPVSENERQGYVVAITHGPNDATRVMLALATADRLPRGDNHIWFAIDGGQICKKQEAEKITSPLFVPQGTAAEMIDRIRSRGVGLHI